MKTHLKQIKEMIINLVNLHESLEEVINTVKKCHKCDIKDKKKDLHPAEDKKIEFDNQIVNYDE